MNILVKPTAIVIEDYELNCCPSLENYFKVFQYGGRTDSFYYVGLYYDEINKKLYLPRGIDIPFVQHLLNIDSSNIRYTMYNEYDSIQGKIKYKPRDDVQKETISFMLGLDKYESNINSSQLSINLNTGKGKSYVSIFTMIYFRYKSIVITYANQWLEQWKKYILEYTNIPESKIHQISGSNGIKMLMTGKSKYNDASVYLITHGTLKSYGEKYGWNKVYELFKKLKIGLKFIDEAHLNFNNTCMIDFYSDVYKTYYITATPMRSNESENYIYQLSMKNVPSIDLFDPEKDPHTKYTAIKFNSCPSPQQIQNCRSYLYGLNRNNYVNYLVNNNNFYKVLGIIMQIILSRGGKALIYIATNDAIMIVYDWIIDNYPMLRGYVGIYTSISENKQSERNKPIILSTTKSAGAAEDIKGLKTTVVLAEPFKSSVIARQTLGRTRDDDTLYLELVDLGFKQTKKYYYSKLEVFNTYATSTSDITLSSTDLNKRNDKIIEERKNISLFNIKE